MKIALLGYGKMGKEIEKIALSKNHKIVLKIDINNPEDLTSENLQKADVAIDFSIPSLAFHNIMSCFEAGVPIVSGTTGWLDKYADIIKTCRDQKQTFFYASNYSVGVNIFFKLNQYLGNVMNQFSDYTVEIEEIHHTQKLDAPSGTAITLAEGLINTMDQKKSWELDNASSESAIKITAKREPEVPGTHTIKFDSDIDFIEIKHLAKSRKGFAAGAVLAAEFIHGKTGVFDMDDLLKLK